VVDFGLEFSLLQYFYKISYDDIAALTYPQYSCLLHNLFAIKKLENGGGSGESNGLQNSKMNEKASEDWIDDNYKLLKAKTGRNEFTFEELNSPLQTIKTHLQSQNKDKNAVIGE
jgi:hypothetical protein